MPPIECLDRLQANHRTCNPICIVAPCRKGECVVRDLPSEARCIDCDMCEVFAMAKGKKPDLIILVAHPEDEPLNVSWIVIEMKRRAQHVGGIIEQLQAGALAIQNDRHFDIGDIPRRVIPVVLHEKGIHTVDVQLLNSGHIRFKGKGYRIKTRRCGVTVMDLLK